MFDKALVCTDLSDASYRLVGCTGHLKAFGIREVVLAHAIDVFDADSTSTPGDQDIFEHQCGLLESLGMEVHVDTPVGHPSFSLAEVARRHHTKLTLLAASGKGLFDAPFSGSVSSDIVLLSDSPVLMNGSHDLGDETSCSLACSRILDHVLFATDFSEAAERAFRVLERMAPHIEVASLVHIQDLDRLEREGRGDTVGLLDSRDAGRLEALRERLMSRGTPDVRTALVYGRPAERVVQLARSGAHTLIVLGSHGRTQDRGALGSVSDTMVREDTAPVLLVP